MTVASRYSQHRAWALGLAEKHDDSDEGRLVALVVLWQCCREHQEGSFKAFAGPRIIEALQRVAA